MLEDIKIENGVTGQKLATSLMRVYCICQRDMNATRFDSELLDDLMLNDGWRHIAVIVAGLYAASDAANVVQTVKELGDMMRRGFYRGLNGEEPDSDFDSLPVRERLAWESVARHATWMVQGDEEDLSRLGEIELHWGTLLPHYAHNRGVTLEPVEVAAA